MTDFTNSSAEFSSEEKKIYTEQMKVNAEYEQKRMDTERKFNSKYRSDLENMILEETDNFTREELSKFSLKRLENMYDYSNYYTPKNAKKAGKEKVKEAIQPDKSKKISNQDKGAR